MPWFFSYSDLGPQEVTTLLGKTPLCMLPATLAGQQISFKGKSRKWGGSTATLERSRKGFVYGSALLVPPDDMAIIENYYKGMKTELVPVFIDASQDKVKAMTCVTADDAEYGLPSDDYVKALLKHLKFFWGQSGGKKPNLEDFGISLTADKPKKAEVVEEPSEEGMEEQPKRRRRSKAITDNS